MQKVDEEGEMRRKLGNAACLPEQMTGAGERNKKLRFGTEKHKEEEDEKVKSESNF